jgi:SsrA-binding protein
MSLADNKKAYFDYEIIEKFSAGIELFGFEVKSLQTHHAQLAGSFSVIRGDEAFLLNLRITPYQAGNTPKTYEAERTRKLLLTKKEIRRLEGLLSQKGLTLLPLSIYNKGRRIKVELGLAKHKKKFDKRHAIKKRDADREIAREVKQW